MLWVGMGSYSGFVAEEVFETLSIMTSEAVVRSLRKVVGRKRKADALVIAHLSEVQERRLHLQQGCSSLTNYCVEMLGMSEDEAGLRVAVAHLVRRVPEALTSLANGRLHLSGLLCLKPHLTACNSAALLARASGKTKREIKELVAGLAPKPDAVAMVRREPAPRPGPDRMEPLGPALTATAATSHAVTGSGSGSPAVARSGSVTAAASSSGSGSDAVSASGSGSASDAGSVADADSGSGSVTAVDTPAFVLESPPPSRYRVQFTASATLSDKLRRLQARLGRGPRADNLADVIEAAVDAKLAELDKRQYAKRTSASKRPLKTLANTDGSPTSRAIPAAVRRAVVERDGEQCSFVAAPKHGGRRCTETAGLEFHHRVPFARGGDHSLDNVWLLCRAHNVYEAERDYGRAVMDRCSSNNDPKPIHDTPDPVRNRSSRAREPKGVYQFGFGLEACSNRSCTDGAPPVHSPAARRLSAAPAT